MPTGAAPRGTVLGNVVTISWPPSTFPNGTDVSGYIVNRYNAATGATATVGSSCSGVVSTTSCAEASVPPGTWIYTDTPTQVNWTGVQSAASAPLVVSPT